MEVTVKEIVWKTGKAIWRRSLLPYFDNKTLKTGLSISYISKIFVATTKWVIWRNNKENNAKGKTCINSIWSLTCQIAPHTGKKFWNENISEC